MNTTFSKLLLCCVCVLAACASTKPEPKLSERYPVITLDRTACFGACPAYTLTLKGDGTARYIGKSNVERKGTWTATVDEKSLRFLMNSFDRLKFFGLKDVYDEQVTDIPTYTLSYTLGDTTKTVTDRFGPPAGLRDLEHSIDSVADALNWMKMAER